MRKSFWMLLVLVCLLVISTAGMISAKEVSLVSRTQGGMQANYNCWEPDVSADGRYVAFRSIANNLVADDTNGFTSAGSDVFVWDRNSGSLVRVSVSSGGVEGDDASYSPSISGDGSAVAFASQATTLVPNDTNSHADIFVRNLQTGGMKRVSVDSTGNEGNEGSWGPSINADGRYVAFTSFASNLVASDNNGAQDVFVHDRQTGVTERVSVASNGTEGNGESWFAAISGNGRYVLFYSDANNLVPGDTNGVTDVFVHDRTTGVTERISVASDGTEANASSPGKSLRPGGLSFDGRYAVFYSEASNLVSSDTNGALDIFVRDRQLGTTKRVTAGINGAEANGNSYNPVISSDGSTVVFDSGATNLVSGDTNGVEDIFAYDMQTAKISRLSVSASNVQGDDDSWLPAVSSTGQYVVFESCADNLVADDDNGYEDIFLVERDSAPTNVSVSPSSAIVYADTKYTITSTYSDKDGYEDISICYLLVNNKISGFRTPFVSYSRALNKLYLRNDAGSVWMGGFAPGSANTIENSYCKLYCADTTVTGTGNTLKVGWSISFKPTTAGKPSGLYLYATDAEGLISGWSKLGALTVYANAAPQNVSLTPNSGTLETGVKTTFTGVFYDETSYKAINGCYLLINSVISGNQTIFIFCNPLTKKIYLRNDTNKAWLGGYLLGSSNVLENSYCKVYCAETTTSGSGKNLTINWKIELKPTMTGKTPNGYIYVQDNGTKVSGWSKMGSYTVE